MNHHASWAHPPRKPKPSRIPVLFFAALATTGATMLAVLIAGGG